MNDIEIEIYEALKNIEAGRYMKHCNVGVPINQRATIDKALEFPLCDSNAGTRISLSDNSFQMSMIFSAPRYSDDIERDAAYKEGMYWGKAFNDLDQMEYLWKASRILDTNMRKHGFKLVGTPYHGHYEQIKNSKEA